MRKKKSKGMPVSMPFVRRMSDRKIDSELSKQKKYGETGDERYGYFYTMALLNEKQARGFPSNRKKKKKMRRL